jgi:DNA-directed RNA polymerase specialized sigma24 family protein
MRPMTPEEFESWIAPLYSGLYAAAKRSLRNETDAENLVQDCLNKLWQQCERGRLCVDESGRRCVLKESGEVSELTRGWAFFLLKKLLLNVLRKQKRDSNTLSNFATHTEAPKNSDPREELERREQWSALRKCMGTLGETDRDIFVRYQLRDSTIAASLILEGCSLVELRRRVNRIKRELFDCVSAKLVNKEPRA